MKKEAVCIFRQHQFQQDMENAQGNMDKLSPHIQTQGLLEGKSSKGLKIFFDSLTTVENGMDALYYSFQTMYTHDQNQENNHAITILGYLLRPKAKQKIYHQLQVCFFLVYTLLNLTSVLASCWYRNSSGQNKTKWALPESDGWSIFDNHWEKDYVYPQIHCIHGGCKRVNIFIFCPQYSLS